MQSGEGNNFITQTIGKEPYLSFSRTNDSPVQYIQLIHSLDHQDLLGWPLVTPFKVQMQKCDKCSQEYCSPVNYRRHIRVHRRSKNVDKEPYKNRDILGTFWDKISLSEATEILSFKDVNLEGVPGSSIVKALASFVRTLGFYALPQNYVKAGSVLLDVIQATPSRLPISSQALFTVLDDASERTFLLGDSSASMQKYIFDGEAAKVGLEMKNLVACTSFLVEQELVKAWIADKDAEALRCQKLLVEEEEIAQRRLAKLLERKRQKKLRQKQQKTKEQSYEEKTELTGTTYMLENGHSAESTNPPAMSEGDSNALEDHITSLLEPDHFFNNKENSHIEGFSSELDLGSAKNVESQILGNMHQHTGNSQLQLPESRNEQNVLHPSQNYHIVKPDPVQKNASQRNLRADPFNGSKIWSTKGKTKNSRECETAVLQEMEIGQTDQTSCQVMIGSISVTVRNLQKRQINNQFEAQKQVCAQKLDSVTSNTGRSGARYWRPVFGDEMEVRFGGQSGNRVSENKGMEDYGGKRKDDEQPTSILFSSRSAQAFLAQRWKEVMSGDYETLVLSQEPEHQVCDNAINDCSGPVSTAIEADSVEHSILGDTENCVDIMGALEPSSDGYANASHMREPKKGVQIKYIAKQEPLLRS